MYETIIVSLFSGVIIGLLIALVIDIINQKKFNKTLKTINENNESKTIKLKKGIVIETWNSTIHPNKTFVTIEDINTGKSIKSLYIDYINKTYNEI